MIQRRFASLYLNVLCKKYILFFFSYSDWPDYESDSDTSQVEAIINQSTATTSNPATPTDEAMPLDDVTMYTATASTNHTAAGTSTPLLDLSHDFVDGNEQ